MPRHVLVLSLLCTALAAQDADADADAPALGPSWLASGYVSGHHVGAADFREHDGRLSVDEVLGEARALWRPAAGTVIGGGVGGGNVHYRSDLLERSYGIGDPMTLAWGRVMAVQFVSEHWGLLAQGMAGTGSDGHAPWSQGFQYQITGGPMYRSSRDFMVMAGVYVASRIRQPATAIPMVSLDWRMAPAWRLRIFDPVDNLSRLTWSPDPHCELGLRLDVRIMEFALDHTSAWGQAAVLRDRRALLGAEATWRPFANDRLQLRPFAGVAMGQAISVRDQWGNELFSDHVRCAPDIGITLRSDF